MRKSFSEQLFEEHEDFVMMVYDACDDGTYSRAEGRYKEIVTELLLFIFLTLRRLFFFTAFLFGAFLYAALFR